MHFHDHDDFVNLDYFERMANAAILTNADILCGEVNQPEYQFPTFNRIEICTDMVDKINITRANNFNPAWRYVYKKTFLQKTGLRFKEEIFGAQDIYFSKPAVVLAQSIATVPGAKYNVSDTPTALGKSTRKNKSHPTMAQLKVTENYNKFLTEHGVAELMHQKQKPYHVSKIQIFNRTVFRRDIWPHKTRYYLFGINIATKYTN